MLVVYHIGGQRPLRASQRRLRGPYPRQKSISILPLMSATNADTPTNNSWIFPPASISDDWLILVESFSLALFMIRTPYTGKLTFETPSRR